MSEKNRKHKGNKYSNNHDDVSELEKIVEISLMEKYWYQELEYMERLYKYYNESRKY